MSSLEDVVESGILIIQALSVTLTLKTVNQFFCMTLWLMMLHKHTKFGNKMFGSLEDIWTNTDILTFIVTLTLNAVILFFNGTLQLMMLYYQTKFGRKPTSNLEDTTWNNNILII